MRLSRLVFWIAVIAGAVWLFQNRNRILDTVLPKSARSDKPAAPAQDDALTEAAKEADKAQGGDVTENMSPEQVRRLLGNPDAIESSGNRERWIYRQAGRVVVFVNGVAVSVESP